jgi:hypothetical protein
MLLSGSDTIAHGNKNNSINTYNIVSSYGNVLGSVLPMLGADIFTNSKGENIHDGQIGAVAVLDSLSDSKKNAIVLFSSLRKLIIMQITISDANKISYNIIRTINMPESLWQVEGDGYAKVGLFRRLALLGTSQNGANKTYHLAIGHPHSKSGMNEQSGRVDFFSLSENSWVLSQPNNKGLASGINGLFFEKNSLFGSELVSIGDMNKNGYNELAVLLPMSEQHPQSAIYIFFMDNEWTPSSKPPIVITGNSMPWLENPGPNQRCKGLGTADWDDGAVHLLASCETIMREQGYYKHDVFIKDMILDSNGDILKTSVFFTDYITTSNERFHYNIASNPLAIKNHKNNLHAIALVVDGPVGLAARPVVMIFSVMDSDYAKNYLLEAGKPEIIANMDSLFYRSGTNGFSVRTLSGLVQCSVQNNNLLCEGTENAIGSWSALELSSKSGCNPYRECKRTDTIFVYVRSQNESASTALRVPMNIVVPFSGQVNLNNVKSFSCFKNPDLQNTGISWNTNGLKLSVAVSSNPNELSIVPFSQKEGIDTLVFNLSISASTYHYPVLFHITESSKIAENGIPQNPGSDTVWNTAQKRYIALPHSNSNGNIYTYDIAQNELEPYAEIIGGYLHILRVDVANVILSYTENGQIKYRKITLMPESKASPPSSIHFTAESPVQNFKAAHINGGLQIGGLNGEFELMAYNFKGMEIQREKAYARGSVFVKLKHKCPQIVQIRSANEKVYIRVVN